MASKIINKANFNKFCGRYFPGTGVASLLKWGHPAYRLFSIIPICALRRMSLDISEKVFPCAWERKELKIAIKPILDSLAGWRAFRPYSKEKLMKKICNSLPKKVIRYQDRISKFDIKSLRQLATADDNIYRKFLADSTNIVGGIAHIKGNNSPMLGSKIMHHLIPEYFPVWDNTWVKNVALRDDEVERIWTDITEDDSWWPKIHYDNKAAEVYAKYLVLIIHELGKVPSKELSQMKEALLKYGGLRKHINFDFFIFSYDSIIGESCFLGNVKEKIKRMKCSR